MDGLTDNSANSRKRSAGPTRRQFLTGSGLAVLTAGAPARLLATGQQAQPSAVPPPMFSPNARWIWDASDRWAYHRYLQARKKFILSEDELRRITRGEGATLTITADAYYQAALNGRVIGAGPAKSAEGRRSVDVWEIAPLLSGGENELLVGALSLGVGTMTYCPGEAGLIFELDLAGRKVWSDARTQVRPDPARQRPTVRRWVLPCSEDIDGAAPELPWQAATVVNKSIELYPRRVPLPSRYALSPVRMVTAEFVQVPNVSLTLRVRPYLTDGEEKRRHNHFSTPAYLLTDIVSPENQRLVFVPTLGNVTWYFQGRKLFEGSGWERWSQTDPPVAVELKKGANRLVGVHSRVNHFEDINLAGFAKAPVEFRNPFGQGVFQVVRVKRPEDLVEGPSLEGVDWAALRSEMIEMDPAHSIPFGNNYDLVYGALRVEHDDPALAATVAGHASEPLTLPPAPAGMAARVIADLGVLHNGWLKFDVEGRKGSTLILAMFEGLEQGPPLRIQWPDGSNSAVAYRLHDGRQSVESFFPYGVRYIVIQHQGVAPVRVSNLRVLTANCGSRLQGALLTDDELLNSIYRICAQSVISGVDDTFTDCPTYEQVNWNFDNHVASMGEAVTCANVTVTRNSIELFAEDPRYPGLVRSQYPSTWDSQIPLWSFHWIMWCRDFYWYTADLEFVRRILPRVSAGVEDALGRVGARRLLEWPGAWHFIEWGKGRDDDHDIMSAEQAGLVGALEAAVQLAEAAKDDPSKAAAWGSARENLIHAINTHLWDDARGAYFDSLHADGSPSSVTSQTTNAAMAAYGVAPPSRAQRLAERILAKDPQLLPYGSALGLFYILEMLDRLEEPEKIFNLVRWRWGEMVLAGDTCTWETFAEWGSAGWPTRSRCHPYAAFVAKYMAKYLLGVRALAPGYTQFGVVPKPPQGMARCHGAVPTPRGLIRVGWERRDGKLDLHVDSPPGLQRV